MPTGDELRCFGGLDYDIIYARVMRKRRFFVAVLLFQLFAAFPVFHRAQHSGDLMLVDAEGVTAKRVNASLLLLPRYCAWVHMPTWQVYELDAEVRKTYHRLMGSMENGTFVPSNDGVRAYCEIEGFELPLANAQDRGELDVSRPPLRPS